jgi:sec-independent protein translocase protein TatA
MSPAAMLLPAFLPNVGWPEAMLILGVILIFFGPQKLPEIAEALGKSIRKFRSATREIKDEIEHDAKGDRKPQD